MRLGFIGTGNMGTAIIKGYLAANEAECKNIYAFDNDADKLKLLKNETSINICDSFDELMEMSDTIILAVKPQTFDVLLPEISRAYKSGQVLVSIAAGISIGFIENFFRDKHPKVVRVMPNTPAMVNAGMSAICKNQFLSDDEFEPIVELFNSVGRAEIVQEELIDTVIGVSGSSPAYTFMYIEALIEGAIANGMSKGQATVFAGQAVLGAAKMVLETGLDPAILRENVCSPGGTTIEAVKALQNNGFQDNVVNAMNEAIKKSKLMTK